MLLKGQFRRTSELPVAIMLSPIIHFCPDRIIIESSASRNSQKALSFSWSLKVTEMSCLENTISVSAKFHTPR